MSAKALVSTLSCLILTWTINVSGQLSPVVTEKLNKAFDSICAKNHIKGASACIIVPNVGIWTACYGESYAGTPITKNTLFGISSNTKTFISSLILKLRERQLLTLEDTIGKWIIGKKNISGLVTVRQLLNHTSGIFNFTENPVFVDSLMADTKRIWEKDRLLDFAKAPYFTPGKKWHYSNTNYILAGIIIEKIAGRPIESLLQEYIFTPLELSSTFYYPQQTLTGAPAHQWTAAVTGEIIDLATIGWSNNALFSMASTSGAIFQTAEDNAKFWQGLFSGRIIGQASLKEMTKFVVAEDNTGYGLGLFRYANQSAINNRTCYGHGGTNLGFVSQNIVDSASKACFSILTNQNIFSEDDLRTILLAHLQRIVLTKTEGCK